MILFLNTDTETGKAVSSNGVRVHLYLNTCMHMIFGCILLQYV